MNALLYYIILTWLNIEVRMAGVDEYLCLQRCDFASARAYRAHVRQCEQDIYDLKLNRWLREAP